MNLTTNKQILAPEIIGMDVRTDKFKTKRISLTFVLPLTKNSAATASLLSRLLSRSTKEYPTPILLQRKLLSLYGARLSSHVMKLGDAQLLNISITVLNEKYALQGENLSSLATELLCSSVFSPNCNENGFLDQDVEICRRLLVESLEGIINDKRKYAISKMYSEMCFDEPFGIELGGDIETANSITKEELYNYWKNMLESAPAYNTVVGDDDPQPIYNQILTFLNHKDRSPIPFSVSFSKKEVEKVKELDETMQLTQGKLVMGFRTDISSLTQDNLSLRMMCDIFGGSPYSKLFTVVREKMSLCYYCAARLQSQKGFICVDSGVDSENIIATKQGILDQLKAIQNGEFDDAIIEASRMSLADGARSVTDSAESIETWYLARLFDKNQITPNQFIENLSSITKEDIIDAAKGVVLDTVYTLRPTEETK